MLYLQEVLAGYDKGQLCTQVLWFGLAASYSLDELGDVVCNSLWSQIIETQNQY